MVDSESIGVRGETVVQFFLDMVHGDGSLFRIRKLGEKWPVLDFMVELMDRPGHVFFIQSKASLRGYRANGRFKVNIQKEAVSKLLDVPVPAYIVGLDIESGAENGYIMVPKSAKGMSSISTDHSLKDPAILQELHDEVLAFWSSVKSSWNPSTSAFLEV